LGIGREGKGNAEEVRRWGKERRMGRERKAIWRKV